MYGKLLIRCDLVVRTGMHIGGSSSYLAIGAVDSPVVRDLRTGMPIVPGSSLKGKLRALLARSASPDAENMPSTTLTADQLTDGKIGILDMMLAAKLVPSKREARQLIQQGGVLLDGEKVTDPTMTVTAEALAAGVVIKKGKKVYHKVQL